MNEEPDINYNTNKNTGLFNNKFTSDFRKHKLSFNTNQTEPPTPSFNLSGEFTSENNHFSDGKNRLLSPHSTQINFTSISHNHYLNSALNIRLSEVESKITKFNDFKVLCSLLMYLSLICLFMSLWLSLQTKETAERYAEFGEFGPIWYRLLRLVTNLIHCLVYLYGLISYNHQSSNEITNTYFGCLLLTLLNIIFFILFIFYVSAFFLTFCVNTVFFLLNLYLIYQASELTKLFAVKTALLKGSHRYLSMTDI